MPLTPRIFLSMCYVSMPFVSFQNDLDDPERGMIFVCSATHKTKSMFFFLTQTEQGDVFKITLETDEDMVRYQATLCRFIHIHCIENETDGVVHGPVFI